MRNVRGMLIGAALGLALAVGVLAPASAAAASAGSPVATAAHTSPVTGEPWSSPAFPVDCVQAGGQIVCTPQNARDIKAQQCFVKVFVGGTGTTVCTTYEAHVTAIQAAGGRPLIVEYGCQIGDVVCLTFENAGRGMAISATATMFAIAQNLSFDTSSLLWTAATGEWSFWQWAILVIVFAAMVWAIAAAIVSGDRAELVSAIVRTFIAIPAVPLTLWMTGHLLNAIDEMTWYIMNRDGPYGLFATLQSVMWAGGQANYFFAFVIHGLLMIGMLLLMLVFTFRNIVLAALIAVGPIAWMLFPVRGVGPQWVVRYVSAVVVLLLTGPLTIGFVTLIINGLANVRTIWDPQSWPLLVGLVLVAFAPFAIFGLFSFVGAVAADGVGSRLGSGAGRATSNAARTVARIPSRIGASPAGIAAGGGKPSASVSSGGGPSSSRPPRGPFGPAGPARPAPSTGPNSSGPTPSAATPAAASTPTASPSGASSPRVERPAP
jgi:hypothetical protein